MDPSSSSSSELLVAPGIDAKDAMVHSNGWTKKYFFVHAFFYRVRHAQKYRFTDPTGVDQYIISNIAYAIGMCITSFYILLYTT